MSSTLLSFLLATVLALATDRAMALPSEYTWRRRALMRHSKVAKRCTPIPQQVCVVGSSNFYSCQASNTGNQNTNRLCEQQEEERASDGKLSGAALSAIAICIILLVTGIAIGVYIHLRRKRVRRNLALQQQAGAMNVGNGMFAEKTDYTAMNQNAMMMASAPTVGYDAAPATQNIAQALTTPFSPALQSQYITTPAPTQATSTTAPVYTGTAWTAS